MWVFSGHFVISRCFQNELFLKQSFNTRNQLEKINLYILGKFVWLLIFFKVTFFRKIRKTIRNTFSIKQFGSRSGPMCFRPCLRETSSLILIQNCFWLTLANEELTGCFLYALNGFFLPIRCINFGIVHYIYLSLFHTCSKQCRPWWNASFRKGLHCLADGTHLCPNSINGSSIIVRKNIC